MFLDDLDIRKLHHYLITEPFWHQQFEAVRGTEDQWALIREIYQDRMPAIMAASAKHPHAGINPSFVNWFFTPIESIAWDSIRALGTPLYPQMPVGQVFIDFANPYFKIGLELDGSDFHDLREDCQRDEMLMQQGWRIFRITGAEAYATAQLPEDYEECAPDVWLYGTSDGVITAIDHIYFREDPEDWRHFELAMRSLHTHRLARFALRDHK